MQEAKYKISFSTKAWFSLFLKLVMIEYTLKKTNTRGFNQDGRIEI